MKRTLTLTLLGLTVPLLAGCIGMGEKPPRTLLTLEARHHVPADTMRSAAPGAALVVLSPAVPQSLAIDRLAVDTGGGRIAYLKGGRWADQPARLFADLLSETIAARTGRVVLDRRQYAFAPGARLAGRLSVFGLEAGQRRVRIVYDAALAPGGGQPLATRRFEASIAAPSEQPEAVAQALGEAANQIAEAVAGWVGG